MNVRNLALSSAASLAIALFAVPPANAQGSEPTTGPQYSTPSEQAATADLNRQQQDGTYASPRVLNGETSSNSSVGTITASADAVQEQRIASNDAQYEADQKLYEENQERWRQEHQAYLDNLRNYDNDRWAYADYPSRRNDYGYDDNHGKRLYLIANPTAQLAQKPIEDPSGAWVGKVRNVETAVDGRPARVEVALNRRVSVWVSPGHFRYDPINQVVLTDLTREDLWQRPGATVGSD